MQLISAFVHPFRQGTATGFANLAPQEDVQEDWGWKLVHGEVFRTPNNPLVLSALVGNGAQLCSMVGVTLGESRELLPLTSDAIPLSHSLCSVGLPLSFKSGFSRHGNDDLLDFLWQVRPTLAPFVIHKAHSCIKCRRLYFE